MKFNINIVIIGIGKILKGGNQLLNFARKTKKQFLLFMIQ